MESPSPIKLRHILSSDSKYIQKAVNIWWGREVSHLLPKLFFDQFQDTSWAILDKDPESDEGVKIS
jgi:hypothetical protein